MVMKRMQKEMDDEGVSEVLGTILTLVITVLLFSSVFIGVQNLDTPDERNYTKFDLSYETITSETEGEDLVTYHINVTNAGGTRLDSESTEIYIISDNNKTGGTTRFTFSAEDDIGDDLDDGLWSIGEKFYIKADDVPNEDLPKELEDPDTKITLMVVDQSRSQVVWQDIVKKPGKIGPIVRKRGVEYTQSWGNAADPGDTVTLYAYVIDKHNKAEPDVKVNLTELDDFDGEVSMELSGFYKPYKENRFELTIDIDSEQEMGSHLLNIIAENDGFKTDSQYIVLNVGDKPASDEAELKVDPDRITVEPTSPVNGDDIIVTSTIYNTGGGATEADVTFYDQMPNGTEIEVGTTTERFPAGGGRDVKMSWTIEGGGIHKITADATEVANGIGDIGSRNLTVIPKILLIDDVLEVNESHDPSVMRNTLNALDYSFTTYTVGGGDGPDYEDVLSGYDIAIWMTGEDTEDTLTETDRENLEKFLKDGNKLWLLGSGILKDTSPGLENWISDELYAVPDISREIESPLRGEAAPSSSNETYEIQEDIMGETDFIDSDGDSDPMLIDRDGDGRTVAVSYIDESGRKSVFQPMLFDAVRESETAGRTRLASQVINWMGNITVREGTDLAITYQEFDNPNPNFMDTVTVTGTIRNNSPEPLATDVTLEVNGKVYEEIHIQSERLPPGGSTTVEFEWLADEVGEHELLIVVDPYNRIDETTTNNNDIRYQDVDTILDVSFTTLMVDHETGDEQRGSTTEDMIDIYEQLDYVYEVYNVTNENVGPTVDDMKMFNSVVWITGEKQEDTLNLENIENITQYHEEYTSSFTLIGDFVLEDLLENGVNQHEEFVEDVLRIDTGSREEKIPDILNGIEDHPISQGMTYHLKDTFDWDDYPSCYIPLDGEVLFESQDGETFAHTYQDSNINSKVVNMGTDLSHFDRPIDLEKNELQWYEEYDMDISDSSMRSEFIFLKNSWLGTFDERIELKVTHEDIHIESSHPFIGQGYELTALIHNYGGTGTEVLVRFKDGDAQIGSQSMYVPAHGSADVELKWEPIHAGDNRPIRVIVDPLDEIAEVPNEPGEQTQEDLVQFNNQAIIYTPVYYFWDDMENGSDYWSHEAQLARINGGNPLDFMGGQ
ncbi:MAG: CARDB domain-containing protein, partial [Candidatus Saliniplasma sp.]